MRVFIEGVQLENRPGETVVSIEPGELFHLYRGNKIQAIKLIRNRLNCGLKEAKDLIDTLSPVEATCATCNGTGKVFNYGLSGSTPDSCRW